MTDREHYEQRMDSLLRQYDIGVTKLKQMEQEWVEAPF